MRDDCHHAVAGLVPLDSSLPAIVSHQRCEPREPLFSKIQNKGVRHKGHVKINLLIRTIIYRTINIDHKKAI